MEQEKWTALANGLCLTCYVVKIRKLDDIVNKILQSSRESLVSEMNAIQCTRDELRSLRSELSS